MIQPDPLLPPDALARTAAAIVRDFRLGIPIDAAVSDLAVRPDTDEQERQFFWWIDTYAHTGGVPAAQKPALLRYAAAVLEWATLGAAERDKLAGMTAAATATNSPWRLVYTKPETWRRESGGDDPMTLEITKYGPASFTLMDVRGGNDLGTFWTFDEAAGVGDANLRRGYGASEPSAADATIHGTRGKYVLRPHGGQLIVLGPRGEHVGVYPNQKEAEEAVRRHECAGVTGPEARVEADEPRAGEVFMGAELRNQRTEDGYLTWDVVVRRTNQVVGHVQFNPRTSAVDYGWAWSIDGRRYYPVGGDGMTALHEAIAKVLSADQGPEAWRRHMAGGAPETRGAREPGAREPEWYNVYVDGRVVGHVEAIWVVDADNQAKAQFGPDAYAMHSGGPGGRRYPIGTPRVATKTGANEPGAADCCSSCAAGKPCAGECVGASDYDAKAEVYARLREGGFTHITGTISQGDAYRPRGTDWERSHVWLQDGRFHIGVPVGRDQVGLGSYPVKLGIHAEPIRYPSLSASEPGAACPGGCGPSCPCGSCQAKYRGDPSAMGDVVVAQRVDTVAVVAGEPARVIYAAGAAEAPMAVLRWHKGKRAGERKADGTLGEYVISHRKSDRKNNVKPIALKLRNEEIAQFDTIGDAQVYARFYERIYAMKAVAGVTAPTTTPRELKWHRAASGGFEAVGALGKYHVIKRTPDRRRGVLPVLVKLDSTELAQFDKVEEGKQFAGFFEVVGPKGVVVDVKPGGVVAPPAPAAAHGAPACGPFARIARDDAAWSACKARADKIGAIDSIEDVHRLVAAEFASYDSEVFVAIPLSAQGELREMPIRIHEGQRSKVGVDPADVLRAVILSGASSFWVAHQHPSGHAKPSPEDKHLGRLLEEASFACFGGDRKRGLQPTVKFLGHVVCSRDEVADASNGKVVKMR